MRVTQEDEYFALLCDARDALHAVIDETDPKTGPQLHRAYREVVWALQRVEQGKRRGKAPRPRRDHEGTTNAEGVSDGA